MQITEFDFDLPAELIAQQPAEPRGASRLLVINRAQGVWQDKRFRQLPEHFAPGDTLVINNTRVFPARLFGTRADTGGKVEIFLVREVEADLRAPLWEVLARPARRIQPGARITFGDDRLTAEVVGVLDETGARLVRFQAETNFNSAIDEIGRTPLPPYIVRDGDSETSEDRARYQTIFAKERGAIAAPTAGLHFTPTIFEALGERGVVVVEVTLHVGYGTFAPVRVKELGDHRVAAERFEITDTAAKIINERRAHGGRTIATGTTTARALESAVTDSGIITPTRGINATELTITPGYKFRAVDALVTNFHLPQSSLLVLVAAFASPALILRAYAHAVQERYRFYSYGDAVLIV